MSARAQPARGRFLSGTSSWSEKGWIGPFYPPGTKPGEMLAYYATQLSTVELDASYYRIPARAMVQGWRAKTPDDFVMSAKFPRSIVHGGDSEKVDAEKVLTSDDARRDTHAFLDVMRELGPKCGPLVVQLPYFNQKAFTGLAPFLERLEPFLAGLPRTFRYAVEVRNKAWLKPELTQALQRHEIALVLTDLVYMPHPDEWPVELLTTDFTYLRLIGDRKAVEAATTTFDKLVLDQSARLERWARLVTRLQQTASIAYAYANNHFAGFGPGTIRELARLVEGGE